MPEIAIAHTENGVQDLIRRQVETHQYSVDIIHRQARKTTQAVECLYIALCCPKPEPRTALVSPQLDMSRRNAWDYLKAYAAPVPGCKFNETRRTEDFEHNGGRVSLFGSDNPDALRGLHHDFCVMDEYSLMDPRTWPEVVLPTLLARNGKALLQGTVISRHDPLWTMYQKAATLDGWSRLLIKASESGLLIATQLASAKAIMSPGQYAREFECEPSEAMDGSIYGRLLDEMERDGRLGRFPWNPSVSVWTGWDIGRDMTAVWFLQPDGRGWNAIDFYQNAGMGLAHYIKVVREKPYIYQQHVEPHDLAVMEYTNDRSHLDVARDLGVDFTVAPRLSVEEGVDQVRRFLPQLAIDRGACESGIQALQNYQYEWSDVLRTFLAKPVHNWASHPSDAIRYFVTGHDDEPDEDYTPPPSAAVRWNVFTGKVY